MYCNHCGKQLPDDSVFCSACGAKVTPAVDGPAQAPTPEAEAAGSPVPEAVPTLVPGSEPTPEPRPDQSYSAYCPPPPLPEKPEFPMRWFKFVINVALILCPIGLFFSCLGYLMGIHYGENAELIYEVFPAIEALDVGMALVSIGLAVYCIVVRVHLAKFRHSGPLMLYIFQGVSIGVSLCYQVAAMVITHQNLIAVTNVCSIIVSIVVLACNCIYFGKRKELFTN